MPESLLDNDELRERETLIQEIEQAFADASYPKGSNLVEDDSLWGSFKLQQDFHGKLWNDVSLELLLKYSVSLSRFTPQAFCYFLPAYILAALLYPIESDTIGENIIFNLAPPDNTASAETQKNFLQRMECFSIPQKTAIQKFVRRFVKIESSYPDPIRDKAKSYWDT